MEDEESLLALAVEYVEADFERQDKFIEQHQIDRIADQFKLQGPPLAKFYAQLQSLGIGPSEEEADEEELDEQELETFESNALVPPPRSESLSFDHPLLSAKEERELGAAIAVGRTARDAVEQGLEDSDAASLMEAIGRADAARERFILCNLRLVSSVANYYATHSGLDAEDLFQDGMFGLMIAVEKFDPERGFKFSTYATHWIRQTITRAVDNTELTIRIPVHMREAIRRYRRAVRRLTRFNQTSSVSIHAIARELDESPERVLFYEQLESMRVVATARDADGDEIPLVDLLPSHLPTPLEEYEQREFAVEVTKSLRALSEREADVLKRRFGFANGAKETLEQIGQRYKVTRERIRQIESKALRKMRARARHLRHMIDNEEQSGEANEL